jgi:hypothetical protein
MLMGLRRLLEFPLARRQRELTARPHLSKKEFVDQTASTDLGRAAAALLWDKLVDVKLYDERGGLTFLDTGISGFLSGHDRREVHAKTET